MKIVVLSGSPHKKGTSALLVDEFIAGATEKGHEVPASTAHSRRLAPVWAATTASPTTVSASRRMIWQSSVLRS